MWYIRDKDQVREFQVRTVKEKIKKVVMSREGENCAVVKNVIILYRRSSETNSQGGVTILIAPRFGDKITICKSISDRVIFVVLKISIIFQVASIFCFRVMYILT